MDSTLPHFKDSRELLLDVLMDVRMLKQATISARQF